MNSHPNILVIRFKSIGDIMFTLPAVAALRENFPGAKITFLTSSENAALLRGFREVNSVIELNRSALRNPLRAGAEFFRLLRRLREGNFSLVVDFQGYGETAWLSWWTGAPERWGGAWGVGRQWAYTRGAPPDPRFHHADWNLSLLRQCGLKIGGIKNEFILPEDALAAARGFFAENNLAPAGRTLFLQPFTSTPHKNWPLENYLELARHFQARGAQVIFGAGPSDRAALTPARAAGFAVSAGVPLLVSAGLVKFSALTVGGDTGLLHLGVAMKKRVLMLMPVRSRTYPFQHADWILAPAPRQLVQDIEIGDVASACAMALEDTGAG